MAWTQIAPTYPRDYKNAQITPEGNKYFLYTGTSGGTVANHYLYTGGIWTDNKPGFNSTIAYADRSLTKFATTKGLDCPYYHRDFWAASDPWYETHPGDPNYPNQGDGNFIVCISSDGYLAMAIQVSSAGIPCLPYVRPMWENYAYHSIEVDLYNLLYPDVNYSRTLSMSDMSGISGAIIVGQNMYSTHGGYVYTYFTGVGWVKCTPGGSRSTWNAAYAVPDGSKVYITAASGKCYSCESNGVWSEVPPMVGTTYVTCVRSTHNGDYTVFCSQSGIVLNHPKYGWVAQAPTGGGFGQWSSVDIAEVAPPLYYPLIICCQTYGTAYGRAYLGYTFPDFIGTEETADFFLDGYILGQNIYEEFNLDAFIWGDTDWPPCYEDVVEYPDKVRTVYYNSDKKRACD